SLLKRAYSKARGRDPENNLPTPKPASFKAHGRGGHTFHAPAGPLVGQRPDDEPLFKVPGVTDAPPQDDDDPKVAMVKRSFSAAAPNAPRRQPNLHAAGYNPEQ